MPWLRRRRHYRPYAQHQQFRWLLPLQLELLDASFTFLVRLLERR
ncbi:hypothetical protein [Mumia zhuanghuii]|nr:hypothetical protein [Mumia zhuanghuii]